jgi:transposase InsO family protein
MDFFHLPQSKNGNSLCLIIVDRLTKLVVLCPCKESLSAPEAAALIMDKWVCRGFGIPRNIISDRDKLFTSNYFIDLCRILGIEQGMSTARHQQSDGLAESQVKVAKLILSKMANFDGSELGGECSRL